MSTTAPDPGTEPTAGPDAAPDAGGQAAEALPEAEPLERNEVPDHARTVVVPVANPDTAPELLGLARAVVRRDSGRVIALVVVLGDADAENNLDRIQAIKEIVDTVRARDGQIDIEVVTRPAASVARGILDATRDENADMVLLGVQAPTPGEVAVGGIAEQVIRAAECDVLVYRRGRHGKGLEAIEGVVAGVDGSADARVAARLGIILGQGLGKPVELLHVRLPSDTEQQGDLILAMEAERLEGADICTRRVVEARTVPQGLRSQVSSNRLTVVGFRSMPDFAGSRLGDTTRGAMDTLRGPVLAISRPDRTTGAVDRVRRAVRRFRPRLTEAEEQSLVWTARLQATLNTDFVVLCVISAMLATFGLLLDSSAVIIGAMLVAPLMSPIVAIGTALVDGEVRTLRRATITVSVGAALVAGTAFLIGLLVGPDAPTAEMLGRGSPSLIDAGVAAASGVVGGYAGARKGIPAALAGVAIAAALVPPICVFGLGLTLSGRLAAGAGLLFVTNIACIAAASAGVLLWLGVHVNRTGAGRKRYVRFTAPVLVGVLAALFLFGLSGRGPDLSRVQAIVEEEVGVEVVGVDTTGPADSVTVTVRTEGTVSPEAVRAAGERVAEELRGLVLRVAVQQVMSTGG